MVIMGMDPSFKALSVSIYDGDRKVYVHTISTKLGDTIGFEKTLSEAIHQWEGLKAYVDSLIEKGCIKGIDRVFSETPPPVGNFSAGLFSLDTLILYNLFMSYGSISEIYSIPPSYLSTVHNTSKYAKSDSTRLAKYFIDEVLSNDVEVVFQDSVSSSGRKVKGRMNNDKAESFLFLLRAFCKYDVKGLGVKIVSEMSGLGHESEKLLITR